MITRRGLACSGIAVLLVLTGCTAPPTDEAQGAWLLTPLTVTDGGGGQEKDLTFGVWNLSDDTAGGVWAESAGSWLGVAADGSITRFNDGPEYGRTALDIAALNPTMLYVLRPLGSGVLNTTVELFDTATRVSEPVLSGQRVLTSPEPTLPFTPDGPASVDSSIGPITSIDVDPSGQLVFVERVELPQNPSGGYVVRRMLRSGVLETLAEVQTPGSDSPTTQPENGEQLRGRALAAASVDVSASDPSGVVIGTEHGVFQITADGTARAIDGALPADSARRELLSSGPGYPVRPVDASPGGVVLPIAAAMTEAPVQIDGGSDRFRQAVLGSAGDPRATGLAVYEAGAPRGAMSGSVALAHARSAVWVAPGALVAIIPGGGGDESGLARIELP